MTTTPSLLTLGTVAAESSKESPACQQFAASLRDACRTVGADAPRLESATGIRRERIAELKLGAKPRRLEVLMLWAALLPASEKAYGNVRKSTVRIAVFS